MKRFGSFWKLLTLALFTTALVGCGGEASTPPAKKIDPNTVPKNMKAGEGPAPKPAMEGQ